MSAELLARLEASRKELLDLGLRNPLVNHRGRAKQIRIVQERSREIFRLLVGEGRAMRFDPAADSAVEDAGADAVDVEEESGITQPEETIDPAERIKREADDRLQTTLASERLQTRLLSIHNDARTYVEEQGVNVLFLALGFLHWYESQSSSEARRAPLLLIPVELRRANARERFQVSYSGDEIGDNLSLIEKLRSEFNVKFPSIGDVDELDVDAYFSEASTAVHGDSRWKVEPNEATLGFFSFGKFLMYKDLDAKSWPESDPLANHAGLAALLIDGFRGPGSPFDDETNVDEVVSPADTHQVVDSDSSQTLAVLDVSAGRNLVLQGPPGTGKSQTITNIIAESVGQGRKVLFVSEKMAALDVVKRRLDRVGLGDAVLELHSNKTNKKSVLEELNRTLHQGRPRAKDGSDDIELLTRLRDELNAYCSAVNSPIGNTRATFVNALGNAYRCAPRAQHHVPFSFEPMSVWSDAEYRQARVLIEGLDRYLSEVGPPSRNPFRISRLQEFLPSRRASLLDRLRQTQEAATALLKNGVRLAKSIGLPAPATRNDVSIIVRAAKRAMSAPHLQGIRLSSKEWQARRDDVARLVASGRTLAGAHRKLDEMIIDDAWRTNLVATRRAYVTVGGKWWRVFSGEYRRARAQMRGLYRNELPMAAEDVLATIDAVLDSQKHQATFDELSELGRSLFGAQWKARESDWEVIERISKWVVDLYRAIGDGSIPEGIVAFLSGAPRLDGLNVEMAEADRALTAHVEATAAIVETLKLPFEGEEKEHWRISLDNQIKAIDVWLKRIDALPHLVRFNALAVELESSKLAFVLDVARKWEGAAGDLVRLFDYSWYYGLVEKAYSESKTIQSFDRTQHANRLQQFSKLDHLLFQHNQAQLIKAHWETIPKLNEGGEIGVLNNEIYKKRRLMPIRVLIQRAGRALQAIKPVFMMSPMSVATYLPPGSVKFDLVVFDEASQVKPVDALGAIRRGQQIVVVGDSKQLPPTSFFDSLIDGDGDGEEEEHQYDRLGDMESILSLVLGRGAHERMLRWHYRSRHDSLIAVSNNEFYENKLVVFPSSGHYPNARGLRLVQLPATTYDRGKTRTNRGEARAVAASVMQHAQKYPDLSLGVVAFSVAQRDAVELELERLRRGDPRFEEFFGDTGTEPFFVKNLENVQGDERDVIFISLGYGKTAEGYMTMQFGPVNRDGGERRLNVLISRARLAMDVFCNFRSIDMDLSRSNQRGVVALKNFLAYAETGILDQSYSTGKEPDSPFEEAVLAALIGRGVSVEPQVGTAGFFIDIGVKDTEHPGRYLLGIECDGANYHRSRSARDRDRLRAEVLRGLGWRLHRIWSTDWYRNQTEELERVLAAIELARSTKPPPAQPPIADGANVGKAPQIRRDIVTPQDAEDESPYPPYERAKVKVALRNRELHEIPAQELSKYVVEIVTVESPVHAAEIARRITDGAGLKRTGWRIQESVDSAILAAIDRRAVARKSGFLWSPEMTKPLVRDRSTLDSNLKKFEWIAPEEIDEAIVVEVSKRFSVAEDEVCVFAARALGFQRTTDPMITVLKERTSALVGSGRLVKLGGNLSRAPEV